MDSKNRRTDFKGEFQSWNRRSLARFHKHFRYILAPITMGNHRVSLLFVLIGLVAVINAGDMMRKSIVFDKNTPDVFYCPQHKPTGFEKMIVRAKPLSKLCQFEGGPIPEDYKSDCYNDVDETEYACKEKYRIMKRFSKADDEGTAIDNDYIEK